ncbi:amino acid--tRNA ligase-related protein, partial [Allisonella histaminiformans]
MTEQTRQHTNEQREIRIGKLDQIRALGYEPFGQAFNWDHSSTQVIENADALEQSGEHVRLAGRLMIIRDHGKTAFATLRDARGDIQLYFRQDTLTDREWQLFHLLDRGDIIGVDGIVFRTHTGEITVRVESYTILTKALRPLPDKWHGLTDKEQRYRMRYVDLIMNPEVRRTFETRTRMLAAIRKYYTERGFLEVETPVLQPLYGGANARPFITHLNALDMTMYLRIAPELYLKRLLVGGIDRNFEITRNFRNEGMDTKHNPEFTAIETYQAYGDIEDAIRQTEE